MFKNVKLAVKMTDAVQTRAYIINNYVKTAENFMKAFAKAQANN